MPVIALVTGPPGHGKSYYAVRKIAQAIRQRKPIATNIALRPDWPEYIARRNLAMYLRPDARRWLLRHGRELVHVSDDLDELFSIRLRGRGEGRGVMILDEAHNWMNARTWNAKGRGDVVRFMTQHRKLGWDVYLIAQQDTMIDAQVRGNFEMRIRLRNLKKARFCGVPITGGVNLFLAIWEFFAAPGVVFRREVFPLGWPKNLYDTMETFAGVDEDDESRIWLPSPPEERTRPDAPPLGGASGAGARTADARELDAELGEVVPLRDPSL